VVDEEEEGRKGNLERRVDQDSRLEMIGKVSRKALYHLWKMLAIVERGEKMVNRGHAMSDGGGVSRDAIARDGVCGSSPHLPLLYYCQALISVSAQPRHSFRGQATLSVIFS
jgi:hypothetical protein